jgi:hypothetical protein
MPVPMIGADTEQREIERRQRPFHALPPCSTSLTSCSIDLVFSSSNPSILQGGGEAPPAHTAAGEGAEL